MRGLQMMLQALGINVSPENIAMLQALIPQLPAKINEVIHYLQGAVNNFDSRLKVLEQQNKEILEALHGIEHKPVSVRPGLINGTTTISGSGDAT